MARIFMTHKVRDYDAWKRGYDADAPRRQGAGLTEIGHFHRSDDRNSFLIVWEAAMSADDTRAMMDGMLADPELGARMAEAGVLDKPSYWIA